MSEKPQKFYSMEVRGREADIYIFGDILVPFWAAVEKSFGDESVRSGYDIVNEIRALDVDVIYVHINSYGGHVSEGIAIHNELEAHKAEVVTITPGFACSAASVVFMAGTRRIMYAASLLMIHEAQGGAHGTAKQVRKAADDIQVISDTACEVYRQKVKISDAELNSLLENETWITPANAVKWGFATEIKQQAKDAKPTASAMSALMRSLTAPQPSTAPTDDKLDQLIKDVAAISAAVSLPKHQEPKQEPTPEPTPELKQEPAGEDTKEPMDFVNALLGGKEDK